jgi:signal transduction histidine kinase
MHLEKTPLAMQHFREAVWYGQYLGDYTLEEDGYLNMAELNTTRLKNIPLALSQNQHALDVAVKNDNPNYKILSLGGLADDYSALNKWTKANDYIMQAIAIAEQIQDRNILNELYTRASRIREGLKDYKGALFYKNKYTLLNDSLLNEKTRLHINDLEARYQTAQKDKAIAQQQLQLQNTKAVIRTRNIQLWFLGSGVAVLLLLSLLIVRLYRQRQKLNNQMVLSMQKEQEVNLLKAVLEGQEQERQRIAREIHDDMGSGLTTILYLCQDLDHYNIQQNGTVAEKIAATARSLTTKMNEIIWSMNREYDTLEDLVAYIRHHASDMLENTALNYAIMIPDTIPAITLSGKARRNIYLAIKEALHNAVKHAQATQVNICIQVNSHLTISVQDNGQGITACSGRRFGNGLQNMRARMDTIGGTLVIQSAQGTNVQLTVPLTANELPA